MEGIFGVTDGPETIYWKVREGGGAKDGWSEATAKALYSLFNTKNRFAHPQAHNLLYNLRFL